MSDHCEIHFLSSAERAYRKIGRIDPGRVPFIEDALESVLDNGWILSAKSELIKVLDEKRQIGEIRDIGSGGYRLFFFWHDSPASRMLFITSMEKKSKLKGRARVNDFIEAAAELRSRYLNEEEEG
jgi:hypothetical protein